MYSVSYTHLAAICDPTSYPEFDAMVAKMVELRKGQMTEEQCRAALSKSNYFGTMLVKMGKADCLLGGATDVYKRQAKCSVPRAADWQRVPVPSAG